MKLSRKSVYKYFKREIFFLPQTLDDSRMMFAQGRKCSSSSRDCFSVRRCRRITEKAARKYDFLVTIHLSVNFGWGLAPLSPSSSEWKGYAITTRMLLSFSFAPNLFQVLFYYILSLKRTQASLLPVSWFWNLSPIFVFTQSIMQKRSQWEGTGK